MAVRGGSDRHAGQCRRHCRLPRQFPPGVSAKAPGALIGRLHDVGTAVVVDTSGPMWVAAVDLVVPNVDEARQALQMPRATARQLAQALARSGVPALVTDGADGPVLAQPDGNVHVATPSPVAVVSTVGVGDALLAGCYGSGWRAWCASGDA